MLVLHLLLHTGPCNLTRLAAPSLRKQWNHLPYKVLAGCRVQHVAQFLCLLAMVFGHCTEFGLRLAFRVTCYLVARLWEKKSRDHTYLCSIRGLHPHQIIWHLLICQTGFTTVCINVLFDGWPYNSARCSSPACDARANGPLRSHEQRISRTHMWEKCKYSGKTY